MAALVCYRKEHLPTQCGGVEGCRQYLEVRDLGVVAFTKFGQNVGKKDDGSFKFIGRGSTHDATVKKIDLDQCFGR